MVLQCQDITKTFHEGKVATPVLRGASMHVDQGEVVALEGPSGSGKTTLLQILGCILSPTSGRVEIEDQDVSQLNARNLAMVRKRSLGFVFQQFNLFPALTVLENVEYALNLKGVVGKAAKAEAKALVDAVELSERGNYLPRDLSGGQKQRVAIARAMAAKPAAILADEPTANLDSQVGGQVLELFRNLARKENRGLLIVTHDPKVRGIADRVVNIKDGVIQS